MMVWVDNERVDINWDVSPVSSPDIVLSHRGEFNRGNDHWPTPLFPLDLFLVPPITPRNVPGIFALVLEGFEYQDPSLLNVQSRKQKIHFLLYK